MKKLIKHILSGCLVIIMVLTMMPTPVAASTDISFIKSQTIYMGKSSNITADDYLYGSIDVYGRASSSKRISNIKSSNTSVVSILDYYNSSSSSTGRIYNDDGTYSSTKTNEYTSNISFAVKKPGTATISFYYNGKKYTSKVTVLKYVNPVKSLTITGVNSTANLASKTKTSSNVTGLKLTADTSFTARVSVSANTGWKVTSICVSANDSKYMPKGEIMWSNYNGVSSKTYYTGTLHKSYNYNVTICFENTSNGCSLFLNYHINN